MRVRSISIALFLLAALSQAVPAQAESLQEYWHGFCIDFKRNNCWPEPFVRASRQAARAPFAIMVGNGWRRQNLLCDNHFNNSDGQLTDAGKRKIRWILTEAPEQHRSIYVHRARTAEETAARIDSVQEVAIHLLPEGALPLIAATSIPDRGWSGAEADAVSKSFQTSKDLHRIPYLPTSSTGGIVVD